MNFKSLISENGKDISMGRVTFWILLSILLYFWLGKFVFLWINGMESANTIDGLFDIPDGLMTAFLVSISYNAYKKLPMTKEK